MKLIEVNKLISDINETHLLSEYSDKYFKLIDLIGSQPAAFDTDKVCEQLEENSKKFTTSKEGQQFVTIPRDKYVEIDTALDIVKNGGVVPVNQVKSFTKNDILNKFDFDQRRAYSVDEIEKKIKELFE